MASDTATRGCRTALELGDSDTGLGRGGLRLVFLSQNIALTIIAPSILWFGPVLIPTLAGTKYRW